MKKAFSLKNPAIWFACIALAMSACASDPAYWMKKYPGASKAKTDRCLSVAEDAYNKAGGTQGRGDNGFAVLAKGQAWEACMDAK